MPSDTTPALYAIKLIDVLRARGSDCQALIQAAGLTARELADREQQLPIDKYLTLVKAAVGQCDGGDLGFLVGEHTGALEHGVLGYALLSSATLGESLQRYTRYQGLLGPLLQVSLARDSDTARMSVSPLKRADPLPPGVVRYFTQEWLATWNPWSKLIGAEGPFFQEVELPLADRPLADLYREHLGCPVRFSGHTTTAEFPAANLGRQLQFCDDTIGALCHEQCELLLGAQQLEHGLTADIHRCLARYPGKLPTMEVVAAELNMTSRTLRRHLQREDTCFQDVVISHRLAMARRYLQETSLPANEIADLVGYADKANFYRTFRAQLGITPQAYRQQT